MRGTSMGGAGRERKGTVQSTQSRNEHRKVPEKEGGGRGVLFSIKTQS